MLVVLRIKKASPSIIGRLHRIFLEVSPGIFVGNLPSAYFHTMWSKITAAKCSIICIISSKNEMGFEIICHGENQRIPVENFGIKLIQIHKK